MNSRVVWRVNDRTPTVGIIITDLADNIHRQYASPSPEGTLPPPQDPTALKKLHERLKKEFIKALKARLK